MPRPDRSRDALLVTTARLLRRQGYAATGLAQVLAESGTTAGSLYHHFPEGKAALAEAAIDSVGASVAAHLSHLLEAEPDMARAVSAWIDGLRQSLTADPRDGCPVMPTAVESIAASPRLRAAATRAFDSWQSVLADRLRQLGWSRRAATDRATALISLIEGAILLARTSDNLEPLLAAKRVVPTLLATPAT